MNLLQSTALQAAGRPEPTTAPNSHPHNRQAHLGDWICCKTQRSGRPGGQSRQQRPTADHTTHNRQIPWECEFAAKHNAAGGRATRADNSAQQPTTQPPDPNRRVNSVCLSLCMCVSVCISLSVSLCICVSVRVSLRVCVSLYVCLCASLCLRISLHVSLPVSLCVCVSNSVPKGDYQYVPAGGLEPICLSSPTKLWHFGGRVVWSTTCTCSALAVEPSCFLPKIRLFRCAGLSWMFQNILVTDPALFRCLAWLIQPTAIT